MSDLLADIEAFLNLAKMTPTVFGRLSLGDPSLVPDLKAGRRLWPETEQKVRTFMRDYRPPADAAPEAQARAS